MWLWRTKCVGFASPLDAARTRSRVSDAPQVLELLGQSPSVTNATAILYVCLIPRCEAAVRAGNWLCPLPETGLVGEPPGTAYANP
ncbi:hypothetical protein BKA82DRAFT_996887 [Pisolithus tinctorius]|uniref:Uncharacterized protein n=1 Tax=Pisolithus tinctorius Marx 270 TaxID=870435 RepID=A0A0C3KI60_PISTI|nr:hypothetical protein BKA82DRAFT_996887 [Pisolithus tinctorius]KIO09292.1 hypothetical protein M404DRAFT_996887 [Pisolithus tinctorius Marx 270]